MTRLFAQNDLMVYLFMKGYGCQSYFAVHMSLLCHASSVYPGSSCYIHKMASFLIQGALINGFYHSYVQFTGKCYPCLVLLLLQNPQ